MTFVADEEQFANTTEKASRKEGWFSVVRSFLISIKIEIGFLLPRDSVQRRHRTRGNGETEKTKYAPETGDPYHRKSTSPALDHLRIAYFIFIHDGCGGLSGAVSRRGSEDGEQQRETEKPKVGCGRKKETQSSKERCARMTAHGYSMFRSARRAILWNGKHRSNQHSHASRNPQAKNR